MSAYTSMADLDAAYPNESALGYRYALRALAGAEKFPEAEAEVEERRRLCGIPLYEAYRVVLENYRAGVA